MNLISVAVFFAGVLIGIIIMSFFNVSLQKKLKEYKRKLEKTSVQSSEDNSKVSVLEAKIATLEKALQSALENKD